MRSVPSPKARRFLLVGVVAALLFAAAGGATKTPRDRVPPTKPTVDQAGQPGDLRPTFYFGSRDNRTRPTQLRFRCAIDSSVLHACARTFEPFSDMAFGRHEIRVVAVDLAGNVSRTTDLTFLIVGIWDAAADFPRTPPSENPAHDQYGNTVWSYLYSGAAIHDPTLYKPLPHFDAVGGRVAAQWNVDGSGPSIVFPLVGVRDASMGFHPSRDQYAILGWRSPYTGTVQMSFTVRLADPGAQNGGDGITWSIDRGNTTLQTEVLRYGNDEHATITMDVTAGDQFYVTIDDRGDSNWDTTTGEFVVRTVF